MIKKINKQIIGWRECFILADLGLPMIKAKIDTGAKTSSLHAFNIKPFTENNQEFVTFDIHPLQKNRKLKINCIGKVVDKRFVSDSGGNREKRYVIETEIESDNKKYKIEITLANRDSMEYRMLLGREAIKKMKFIVDVNKSFILGSYNEKEMSQFYKNI